MSTLAGEPWQAIYLDGITSTPQRVALTLDEQDVLHVHSASERLSFPLRAVKIGPPLGSTPRLLTLPGGGRCELLDQGAVQALERRRGGGGAGRLLHRLESSGRWALIATLALALITVAGSRWGVPLLAERLAHAVPSELAFDLGRGTLEALDRTLLRPSKLPRSTQERLRAAFADLARQYPDVPVKVVFRSAIKPNAFALPDGTVIMTDELVELATDDQQVLAVLAHEMGHLHHRHILRLALESSAVVLLLSAYLGDVSQLTTLSATLPSVYAQAHYSREHETEADTFALRYLDAAGIPRHHFATALRALQRAHGRELQGSVTYLDSHPPTSERLQRFEQEQAPSR